MNLVVSGLYVRVHVFRCTLIIQVSSRRVWQAQGRTEMPTEF